MIVSEADALPAVTQGLTCLEQEDLSGGQGKVLECTNTFVLRNWIAAVLLGNGLGSWRGQPGPYRPYLKVYEDLSSNPHTRILSWYKPQQ